MTRVSIVLKDEPPEVYSAFRMVYDFNESFCNHIHFWYPVLLIILPYFPFDTITNLLRRSEAWIETKLKKELAIFFKSDSFSAAFMQKLLRSVISV